MRGDGETARTDERCAPGGVALLIIDMINDLDFDGGEALRPKAEAAAKVILNLRDQADRLSVPVICVNDNYDQWHSERSKIVAACKASEGPGRRLAGMMAPRDGDYFVMKPQFSGFYATNLTALLPKLGVHQLVLTGIAADICVLFTAADAHMRDYDLWAPRDAVASEHDERTEWALDIMHNGMAADCRPSTELDLADWVRRRETEAA